MTVEHVQALLPKLKIEQTPTEQQFGVVAVGYDPLYDSMSKGGDDSLKGVESIVFLFSDGRIAHLRVHYYSSVTTWNLNEYIDTTAKSLGLPAEWDDLPVGEVDFTLGRKINYQNPYSTVRYFMEAEPFKRATYYMRSYKYLDCKGFRVLGTMYAGGQAMQVELNDLAALRKLGTFINQHYEAQRLEEEAKKRTFSP